MKIVLGTNQTSTTGYYVYVYVYVYCSSTYEGNVLFKMYLSKPWYDRGAAIEFRIRTVLNMIHIDIKYGFSFFNLKSKIQQGRKI